MKRVTTVLTIGVALALVVWVAGCSALGGRGGADDPTASRTNPEPPAPIELSMSDSGSTQRMQPGQQLLIVLDANPTTGYMWQVDSRAPRQLKMSGEPEFVADSDAIGAGGKETWAFVAAAIGQGRLRMSWQRPWEDDTQPAKTFEVNVNVE